MSSFLARSSSGTTRQSRKINLSRFTRPSISFTTIFLPTLCLALLILPHFNLPSLKSLSGSSVMFSRSSRIINDNEIEAVARRNRLLPPCASTGKRATSFLMVFMGHSGSTAMISELRTHSEIHIEAAELVDHQHVFNTTDALETIRKFFDNGIAYGKIPGFKIRPSHILNEPQLFKQLVKDYDTRIVWQYRKNIFKASIGEYATRFLNDTRGIEGLKKEMSEEEKCSDGAGCSFRIDNLEFLHKTLKQKTQSHRLITSAVNALAGSSGCVREIPYEDYLYDREAVMQDAQRFLGVRYERTEPERFKATGDSMCRVVENWDEVCASFYGCMAWQHMMTDAKNECFCDYTTGTVRYCDSEV